MYPQTKFLYRGTFWTSAEHAFQAAKCKDGIMDEEVRKASTPKEAKRIGRRAILRSDWEDVKVDYMTEIVFRKFTQNERLKKKLLATGDIELEEGNYWHDNIWGNCYCPKCENIEGQNILGIILMEVREFLQ